MANEITTARTKIKTKLDISDTTFDTMLLDCIEQAVPRLSPWVQYHLAADETISIAQDVDVFTLPVSTSKLDKLYARYDTTDSWRMIDLWRQHRNKVYLMENPSNTIYFKILAHRPYAYSDADLALLATDFPGAMLALYLFSMAEFYTMVVGNKRKFNIYQQATGNRTVDEMKDLVLWCENRAMSILENDISAEGQ